MYENQYLSTVRAPQGFVLLCTSVQFFFFIFLFYNLTYSRWTSSLPSCLWSQRIFPSLPVHALLLVNQWLNFTYSRSHVFRYERKNTNPTLVRIEITTSALEDVQVNYQTSNPQGLPIVLLVLVPQGFVLLCLSVRCESQRRGASSQRLCASVYCTSSKSFVQCEPTKALYSVRQACASVYCTSLKSFARCEPIKALYLCVPYERQELRAVRAYKGFVPLCAVRAPRACFGASLQRLYTVCTRACASVYCTSLTSFVRCEPTKALYSALVLAPKLCTECLCARAVV